jgi:hypothetical protein
MKLSILLGLLLFCQLSWSLDPSTFCDANADCTQDMKNVVEAYKQGNSSFANLNLSAYSGDCWHLNFQYDANHTHHGAFAFEKNGKVLMTSGVFSFFWEQDPYANLTAEELKTKLQNMGSPAAINTELDPLTLEYLYPETEIVYWFRSSADSKQLTVIGREARLMSANLVFCKMQKH